MGEYTNDRENLIFETEPESDHYIKDLIRIAATFRSTGGVLDEYIKQAGYEGSLDDADEKAEFMKEQFVNAGIAVPRDLKAYFLDQKRFRRRTAYHFCFALKLDAEKTKEFFSRCYLGRGFDFHDPEEVIFYYCIQYGLSYSRAEELIAKVEHDRQEKAQASEGPVYTSEIENDLRQIDSEQELTDYINDRKSRFAYSNVTACRYITDIWKQLTDPGDGLLIKETGLRDICSSERKTRPEKMSLEAAYIWMLGLEDMDISIVRKKRSLKEILKDNILMHPIAEESFPDRNSLKKIMNKEKVSYEGTQKILILLLFYRYWAKKAVSRNGDDYRYRAKAGEAHKCHYETDRYLTEAGYNKLYCGNPYDWIFLFCMYDEYPLEMFREYMRELFLEKQKKL